MNQNYNFANVYVYSNAILKSAKESDYIEDVFGL